MPARDPNMPGYETVRPWEYLALLAVAASVVFRFVTTSPLWLDEALSVNIASLPLGDIGDALRRDGHPPLYYWLLHLWIEMFGTSDVAVRSLSGVLGVAALPLAWIAGGRRAGRRGALATVVLVGVLPWSVRYGSETRMYSLVFLLVLAGWLLADDLRRSGSRWRWLLLAACTGAAVLSHYWVLYTGIAAVGALAVHRLRLGTAVDPGVRRVASALAAGALAFVPWLGAFFFQAAHTGTPWAGPSRPTQIIDELAAGIGGGRFAEATVLGWVVLVLAVVGALARPTPGPLTLSGVADAVRPEVAVVAGVLAVGSIAGYASGSTFVGRYAAAFLPMLVVVAGVGVARLPSRRTASAVVVVIIVLSMVGWAHNVVDDRTQGEEIARTIEAGGRDGDLVAVCPDQLGPATTRSLADRFDTISVPLLTDPTLIDWVDYAERNEAADTGELVDALLTRSEGRAIWFVTSAGYATYGDLCEQIVAGLGAARPGAGFVVRSRANVFEPMALFLAPAR